MGASVGTQIRSAGQTVLWASDGRSADTAKRAHDANAVSPATAREIALLVHRFDRAAAEIFRRGV
jgi:hypothetical protein